VLWEGVGRRMGSRFVVEHLNHLGIVAEVCREIGVADWLDPTFRTPSYALFTIFPDPDKPRPFLAWRLFGCA
jgi:hypothetical protein